jgi:hypothetical protein
MATAQIANKAMINRLGMAQATFRRLVGEPVATWLSLPACRVNAQGNL